MSLNLTNTKFEVVSRNGKPSYAVVEVPSSTPGKFYRVDVVNQRCSCPGWTMHANKDGTRNPCKHLRALGFKAAA